MHIQLGVAHALLLFVAQFTRFGHKYTAHLNLVCQSSGGAGSPSGGGAAMVASPDYGGKKVGSLQTDSCLFLIQLANCCSHSICASSLPHVLSHALSFFSRRAAEAVAAAGAPIGPRLLSLSQ